MKTIFSPNSAYPLIIALVAIIVASCSDDSDNGTVNVNQNVNVQSRDIIDSPLNPLNDYDLAGQIHNELLSTYFNQLNLPVNTNAIAAAVEQTAVTNPNFISLKSHTYTAVTGQLLDQMLNSSFGIEQAIERSRLSPMGKASLLSFITTITGYITTEQEFNVVYDFSIAYEHNVHSNGTLTSHDKEIILTTASIIRHSVHFRKKRPKKNTDPDWDWLTVNIVGGVEGASHGMAESITHALAGGIAENRK